MGWLAEVVQNNALVVYYCAHVCFNDLEEILSRKTRLFLLYSIGLALHMSSSYHLAYVYLFLIRVLWSRHLKSYLSMLGENRSYSAYLVHKKVISSNNYGLILFKEETVKVLEKLYESFEKQEISFDEVCNLPVISNIGDIFGNLKFVEDVSRTRKL